MNRSTSITSNFNRLSLTGFSVFNDADRQQLDRIHAKRSQLAIAIQAPPLENLVRVHAMLQRHPRHRCTRFQRLLHNATTLHRAPPPPTSCPQLPAHNRINHPHIITAQQKRVHAAITGRLRFNTITKVFVDGGYTGKLIGWAKDMFGYDVEVVKRNELHTFKVLPKRWIVERTFAWLNWSRRLSKDYELHHTSSETMIHIAFAHLLLRRHT